MNTAVGVYPVHVGVQSASPAEHDGSERLVDLEDVDIIDLQMISLEQLSRGGNRPFEHQDGVAPDQHRIDDSRSNPAAKLSRLRFAHQQHSGGAIGNLR